MDRAEIYRDFKAATITILNEGGVDILEINRKRTSQIRSSTYEKETNEEFRAEKKNHWVGSIEEWIW